MLARRNTQRGPPLRHASLPLALLAAFAGCSAEPEAPAVVRTEGVSHGEGVRVAWQRGGVDGVQVRVAAGSTGGEHRLRYSLALGTGSSPWLESAPVAIFAAGLWYEDGSADGGLTLTGAAEWSSTDARLGAFDALTVQFAYGLGSAQSFNATFKYFPAGVGSVVFEQALVSGIPTVGRMAQPPLAGRGCMTGINTTTLPLAEFPAFRSGPDTRLSQLGYTTWAGTCCWRLRVSLSSAMQASGTAAIACELWVDFLTDCLWLQVGGGIGLQGFMGGAEGGPLVLFDANQTGTRGTYSGEDIPCRLKIIGQNGCIEGPF